MVYAALQLGLMLARWLLESELSARALAIVWPFREVPDRGRSSEKQRIEG